MTKRQKRWLYPGIAGVGLAALLAVWLTGTSVGQLTGEAVAIDSDDIGGVVSGPRGPEAGVWVIAETKDLPTGYRKIVITDDQGRYVMPDLPKANYRVWVRGYGLVDSMRVQAMLGKIVNLTAILAPNPRAAAEIYPPNYWLSLLDVPPKSDFPGTGLAGNGIAQAMRTQAHWIAQLKGGTGPGVGCSVCHQLGGKAMREAPKSLATSESSVDAWDRRVQSGHWGGYMSAMVSFFGRQRALTLFADWTDRIAAGEVPPPPPRPQGVERNVVITQWDWSDPTGFVHDTISTDKRNPTINANGLVFSTEQFSTPDFNILDPVRHTAIKIAAPVRDRNTPFAAPQGMPQPSPYWGEEVIWQGRADLHNPMMDHKGRVWLTHTIRPHDNPDFCKKGSNHPSAKHFPLDTSPRQLSVYDPQTKKFTLVDTCFGTHHLQFAFDDNDTLWAGAPLIGQSAVGWLNTKLFDETGDALTSQGWVPFILDTNRNGKQDPWVEPDQPIDPTKDKRIAGDVYGIGVSPTDGSIWIVPGNGVPGYLIRVNPGSNPPTTALAEIYEPPFNNSNSPVDGYTPRGVDVDREGVVWTSLSGSGHLARFDRRKCKVLNGPTATGQHCPEGWTLYQVPGPMLKGTNASADSLYYNWVDQFDTFGLGRNVPIGMGTNSNALLALVNGKFVVLNVPYPLGFAPRGVDGRIDNPNAGWKGKGLWSNFASQAPWHYEGGKGTRSKAVKLQLRPNPLAK